MLHRRSRDRGTSRLLDGEPHSAASTKHCLPIDQYAWLRVRYSWAPYPPRTAGLCASPMSGSSRGGRKQVRCRTGIIARIGAAAGYCHAGQPGARSDADKQPPAAASNHPAKITKDAGWAPAAAAHAKVLIGAEARSESTETDGLTRCVERQILTFGDMTARRARHCRWAAWPGTTSSKARVGRLACSED